MTINDSEANDHEQMTINDSKALCQKPIAQTSKDPALKPSLTFEVLPAGISSIW
jgi:hypothetical protein